jgi:predicted DNA-binding transcriptional regulator AlpA
MNNDELMTTVQVAKYLGIAVSTLTMYRTMGAGPQYIKVLRRLVRYRRHDVDLWLTAQEIAPKIPESY